MLACLLALACVRARRIYLVRLTILPFVASPFLPKPDNSALGVTYETSLSPQGGVLIGTVPVIMADLASNNGIAHIIGGLLLPPSPTDTEPPSMAPTPAPAPDDMPMTTEPPTMTPSAAHDYYYYDYSAAFGAVATLVTALLI